MFYLSLNAIVQKSLYVLHQSHLMKHETDALLQISATITCLSFSPLRSTTKNVQNMKNYQKNA